MILSIFANIDRSLVLGYLFKLFQKLFIIHTCIAHDAHYIYERYTVSLILTINHDKVYHRMPDAYISPSESLNLYACTVHTTFTVENSNSKSHIMQTCEMLYLSREHRDSRALAQFISLSSLVMREAVISMCKPIKHTCYIAYLYLHFDIFRFLHFASGEIGASTKH